MKESKAFCILTAILFASTLSACGEKKIETFAEYISNNNFSEALDYYSEKIDGTKQEKDSRDLLEDEIEERYNEIITLYWEEKIDSKQIENLFELLDEARLDEEDYESFAIEIEGVNISKENYKTGLDYFNEENYEEAEYYFACVNENDINYQNALDKIKEIEYIEAQDGLENIKSYIDAEYFYDAYYYIQNYSNTYASNEDILTELENLNNALLDAIISSIQYYIDNNDFSNAKSLLDEASGYYDNNTDLISLYDTIDEAEIAYQEEQIEIAINEIIEKAYDSADAGDWDTAVNSLIDAQNTYSSDERLVQAYEDIVAQMPITLKNITKVSSSRIEIHTEVVSDRWGNHYDGGVRYNAEGKAFALYNLDNKYTKFEATVWVGANADNGRNMSIAIYLDEELAYYEEGISEETAPFTISLDITGHKTIKISTDDSGSWESNSQGLWFTDSYFTKVGEEQDSNTEDNATTEQTDTSETE